MSDLLQLVVGAAGVLVGLLAMLGNARRTGRMEAREDYEIADLQRAGQKREAAIEARARSAADQRAPGDRLRAHGRLRLSVGATDL